MWKPSLVLASLAIGACGAARVVESNPNGGVIALEGLRSSAMPEARKAMDERCGRDNYVITRQWEEPVGAVSQRRASATLQEVGSGTYIADGSSTTRTQQTTEWRIAFECGSPPARDGRPSSPDDDDDAPPPPRRATAAEP